MTPTPEHVERELRQSIADAERGVPTAARRAAELLELIDRDSDAAAMWRYAAELGEPDAIDYVGEFVRGDTILSSTPNQPADLLDAVLDRQSAAVVAGVHALLTPQWIETSVAKILALPICAIHRVPEPDLPGDYKSCGECVHVWRTEEEFVADVRRDRELHTQAQQRYEPTAPAGFEAKPEGDPREQPFCPLCHHDF